MEYLYEQMDVVIKIAERCNINCSYCYMFNRGNDDYLAHPVYISEDIVCASAKFLAQGARDLNIKAIRLIFHGGEPLMLKKERFSKMCELYLTEISPYAEVAFVLQTNGMLVDDDWIAIFERYQIGIGVSIDGPKEYHDIERLDHNGNGTYDRVIVGLKKLQTAYQNNRIGDPGVLCVINPTHDAKKIYRHLIDDLGFKKTSFLLPMESLDSAPQEFIDNIGVYLCGIFDQWAMDDNPQTGVRIVNQVVQFLVEQSSSNPDRKKFPNSKSLLVSLASNGDLGGDDDLKPLNIAHGLANIRTSTLRDFVGSPVMLYLDQVAHSIPTDCLDCCWQNYCRGGAQNGALINRYSVIHGFNNKSVFCSGLQVFFSQIASYLLAHGLTLDQLTRALDHDHSPYKREIPSMPQVMKSKKIFKIMTPALIDD